MSENESILNASVPDQLRAIANWHDSENPSRLALGAVASCALNHVHGLESRITHLTKLLATYGAHHPNCPPADKGKDCACGWLQARREAFTLYGNRAP